MTDGCTAERTPINSVRSASSGTTTENPFASSVTCSAALSSR